MSSEEFVEGDIVDVRGVVVELNNELYVRFLEGFLVKMEELGSSPRLVRRPGEWVAFGSHMELDGPLEFSKDLGEDGLPLWQRLR